MKRYIVTLLYNDLDGTLYTDYHASVIFTVEAPHLHTAHDMARHLLRSLKADDYKVEEQNDERVA